MAIATPAKSPARAWSRPSRAQGWDGLGPFITIDHVLADERLGIVEYGVAEQPGSDHRAIHAVLALP